MNLHLILCPLEDKMMTLTPEIMEKLAVSPGDKVYVIKLDNLYYLCSSNYLQKSGGKHAIATHS